MISSRLVAGFQSFLVIGLSFMGNPALADALSELSAADQAAVARICLPVQYQSGSDAYRQCVLNEADIRGGQSPTATASLSFDEQYAVQQICQPIASSTAPAYQQCVDQQIEGLDQIPVTQLDTFENDEIFAIQQSCFDIQTSGGVKAYRQCINSAAADLQSLPRPDLSSLTLLERNALQLECSDPALAAADYRQCLLNATGESSPAATVATTANPQSQTAVATPESISPVLPSIAETSSTTAQQTAATSTLANTTDTLSDSAIVTDATSEAATGSIPREPNNLPAPIPEATDAPTVPPLPANESQAGEQLSAQASNTDNLSDITIDSTTDNAITVAQAETTNNQMLETTESDDALSTVTNSAITGVTADGADSAISIASPSEPVVTNEPASKKTSLELAISTAKEIWAKVQASVSDLDNMSRVIISAAIALPILLLGFWLLMRGRNREPELEYHAPRERSPLIDRVGPSQQRREQPPRDFDMPLDQTNELNLSQQADDMFGELQSAEAQPVKESVGRTTTQHLQATNTATVQKIEDVQTEAPGTLDQLDSTERAGYLAWLNHQSSESRQSLAIEFLIYWMAYGDDRFEPAMKKTIFQIKDPDEHERIKRWVLMQDIYAFSDAVYWLQHNTNKIQKEQILDLLMALLINENALTPVQNTVLRFLGDAFGLGNELLDARFRQAFGHPMPPMPRVDKPRWWDQQTEDQRRRWDARKVSMQNRAIQYRVKMGLPLSGEVQEEEIIASFRRAAARCLPQRFDQLGPREQLLAERQLEKFEFAKDSLLEVSA